MEQAQYTLTSRGGDGGGGIGCARDRGVSNGINGMPLESYNIAKILGNEVCLKILGTCTSFRQ